MDYHVEHGEQLESEVQNIKHPNANVAPVAPAFQSFSATALQDWKFGTSEARIPFPEDSSTSYRIEHDGWLRIWLITTNLYQDENGKDVYEATKLFVVVNHLTVAGSSSGCGHTGMHSVDENIVLVPVKAGDTFSFTGSNFNAPNNTATITLMGIRS